MHLKEVADGKTYAQVSTLAQADPTNTQLRAQVNTLFKGETLRGHAVEALRTSAGPTARHFRLTADRGREWDCRPRYGSRERLASGLWALRGQTG